MSTLLKSFLRRDSSDMSKSPSFNDFSLSVGQDVEEELRRTSTDSSVDEARLETRTSLSSTGSAKSALPPQLAPYEAVFVGMGRRDVWQSVFNPGRNYNLASDKVGRSYFDHVDDPKAQPTTWEYICKSENVKRVAEFDVNNDGFVTADEVRTALGSTATIEDLIRKTDKHGDGRVAYKEFFDLIRQN